MHKSWPACLGVTAFLLAQLLCAPWIAGQDHPPPPPDLASVHVPQWQAIHDDPIDPAVIRELGADRWINKSYMHTSGSLVVNLFVAWFQSQRGGTSQPHSPQVCLPASGWTPTETSDLTLNTADGPVPVNRYIVQQGEQRAVVLYWYQTPRRAVASEWASKFWSVAGSLQFHRTDVALVRVIVYEAPGQKEVSSSLASEFVRGLYPALRQRLPR